MLNSKSLSVLSFSCGRKNKKSSSTHKGIRRVAMWIPEKKEHEPEKTRETGGC